MKVRTAVEADVAGVVALERVTADAPHWEEVQYSRMIGPEEPGMAMRRRLFVAELEGRLLGFAVARFVSDVGELESVVVAEEERRRGVGAGLCGAVVDWCGDQGAKVVELEVRSRGMAARGLYERMGFQRMGLRKGYYGDPVDDAVLMGLKLRD